MQISKSEWDQLLGYIRDRFIQELGLSENRTRSEITRAVLIGTLETITQEEFLADTDTKKERKKVVVSADTGFMNFWNSYPVSGNFEYRGMKFKSSRVLRSNYQVCEMLYQKGLKENGITGEQATEALKKHVKLVKEESYESGENRMQYFPAIEPYLRQAKYMAFVGQEEETEDIDNNSNCA